MTIRVQTIANTWLALGLAAHFLSRRDPFAGFPSGDLIRTLNGQIERRHYLFAFDVAADPARVAGYMGWAVLDTAVAERFAAGGTPPSPEEAQGRDVVWILTAAADSPAAFDAIKRAARALYPAHRVMAIRHRHGKRVILDRRHQ